MFHKARLKLSLLYSLIFLVLFWSLSLGIYLWMNRFFGDEPGRSSYIQVHHAWSLLESSGATTEPLSDVVMDELRNVLLFLDIILLFAVPAITWFLTGRTLSPVQEAHDREKQFLTDASHDLRTPLTILQGEIELALRNDSTKDEYKETLVSNKEEVDDLIVLIENMLFFARENKQYGHMPREKVDITDILAERIAAFQQSAKRKNLSLSLHLPELSITITGNQQLLKRLFTSLLDNAIKYTPSGGSITAKIKREANMVVVSITDTGIGIAENQQDKVFDRFYRADTSRSHKGYGIGLSIVSQIVEFHGGDIRMESKEGKGTTMIISLPIFTQSQERNRS